MSETPCTCSDCDCDCQAVLSKARIFYECAAAEKVRTAEIRDEIAVMHAEAKKMLAQTLEMNRRASLELAQTDNAH